jgi:hypothetical protein
MVAKGEEVEKSCDVLSARSVSLIFPFLPRMYDLPNKLDVRTWEQEKK